MRFRLMAAGAALALMAAAPAGAYYHFIHYLSSGNAPEKFDLTALPSKTVTFFVSESGPTAYSPTDTFNSVIGQIQQAAALWNGVATSDLRVAFGGFENSGTPQNGPGGDVVFEDLAPGVEGFGGPTSQAAPVTLPDGTQFYPIVRSSIHLNSNLVLAPGPSFNQSFLLTTVHEMGHALGLQHTFTSSAMSQATTRTTSLALPIDNDDIAGISVLYPNAAFQQTGSISGQIVDQNGAGVHLASVVAIQPGTGAVSAVTNPDGTYRIDGLPPGNYEVYVHTMPPDADIYGPWNADGSVAAASAPITPVFYSKVIGAAEVAVTAGTVTGDIDISAVTRDSLPYYDGQVYGYFGTNAVMPAPVDILTPGLTTVAASVVGLGSNGQVPSLAVQITGGVSVGVTGIRPYEANGYTYVALDLSSSPKAQPGPQHIIFSTPDFLYILPSAINLTQAPPPSVTSATGNGDGTVTVTGANWNAGTLIYFDSLPATIASLDTKNGVAVVIPPAGAAGQTATLTAFNSDGQNSQFVAGTAASYPSAVTYTYSASVAPAIAKISPASLPAGAEATVDITGTGFSFTQGLTSIGFGTSDILVRRIFVLSDNHVQVDVSVAANAALTNSDVTAISGFAMATATAGFEITAPVAGLPAPIPVLTNAVAGLNGAYPGATVTLTGSNLAGSDPATGNAVAPSVTLGGQAVTVSGWSVTQLTLQIPQALPSGAEVLTVNNGTLTSYPVLVNIDAEPAGIAAVQRTDGSYVYSGSAAHLGDTLIVTLLNLAPAGSTTSPSRVQVGLGGVMHAAQTVVQIDSYTQVTFQIGATDPTGDSQQLVVYLDGRSSLAASIPVEP